MATSNIRSKSKIKATVSKTNVRKTKRRKKRKKVQRRSKVNSSLMFVIAFFSGILLIISSYAWLSASLNVKVKFFNLSVSTDNGLFISLDGIDYSDAVEISIDSVINDLRATYPNNTNQWAVGGLWPVSSNGIKSSNDDKFSMYIGEMNRYKNKGKVKKRYLNANLIEEKKSSAENVFISFDVFLKNVSGSPNPDNLFLGEDTFVDYDDKNGDGIPDLSNIYDDSPEDIIKSMSGIMNSMRFGFVRINSTALKSSVETVQNMKCENRCQMLIFEPNSTAHSELSIETAKEQGIDLVNGVAYPTYAVIKEGRFLEHANGQAGTGYELDTEHFALQKTITEKDFVNPIFEVPNGITKMRAYVWIEGQDVDSLETTSRGLDIFVSMHFVKDLAGYE